MPRKRKRKCDSSTIDNVCETVESKKNKIARIVEKEDKNCKTVEPKKTKIARIVEEEDNEFSSIKMTLKTVLNEVNSQFLIRHLSDMSCKATRISFIGSLWVLFQIQTAFESNQLNFFERNPTDIVERSFYAVLDNRYCNDEFEEILRELEIEKPNNINFTGNAFNYNYQQYLTNFENTNKLHGYNRYRRYCRTFNTDGNHFSKRNIGNTAKFIFNSGSTVQPNIELLGHLIDIGLAPNQKNAAIDVNNQNDFIAGYERGFLREMIDSSWFEMLPIFL